MHDQRPDPRVVRPQRPDFDEPGRRAEHGYALIKDIEDFAGIS
jgi:hypothetical protein